MNFFKTVSYLFHPIVMPITGAIIYFIVAPRFLPEEVIQSKIYGLFIITVLIPIVCYFLLKTIGAVTSINLDTTTQRKIPLVIQSALFLLVLRTIVDSYNYPELYFFFVGTLFSALCAFFMAMFNVKASLHMIGVASVTMFLIILSIHFGVNLTNSIAIASISTGLVATSRLFLKAHNPLELTLGIFIGVFPQILLVNFWL
ncbi:hypothetical protein [Aquimarina intermedia]|uniref:PAP2 superfamily protein n=1 Tax=Aquimarina intermedia TaxID=350814 RepID=A0A5S5CA94_9FLAO|nr:hypothetical protein [Aquimarina intermedia]TYP76069.1 hypothetical protein BD809_102283 [Aquimarina intermedia]